MSKEEIQMPAAIAAFFVIILMFAPLLIDQTVHVENFDFAAIGYSTFIGVVIAFFGYAKSGEPFDPEKFIITPIVGAITGVVMGIYGFDYTTAQTWLQNAGVLSLVEIIGKAIVRRLWKG